MLVLRGRIVNEKIVKVFWDLTKSKGLFLDSKLICTLNPFQNESINYFMKDGLFQTLKIIAKPQINRCNKIIVSNL